MRELCPNAEIATPWYALTVRHQHEWQVEQLLQLQGWPTLVPSYRLTRQWSDRTKSVQLPLFAGYVFCQFAGEDKVRVMRTPGVANVVSFAGAPAALDSHEIDNLQQAVRSGLPLHPWSYLKPGDRVRVERGPLKGVEGTLLCEKEGPRLVLSIELLHRAVSVEVSPDMLSVPIRERNHN
jgi:transcription antitermination factor NusG